MDHIIVLFLIFKNLHIVFHNDRDFTFPPTVYKGPFFSASHQHLLSFVFLYWPFLPGRSDISYVLICISMMMTDADFFSYIC
jgi:hypothetical protein